jgi:AraC family transcriptional regulator
MSASQYIAAYQGKSSIAEKVVISGANFPGSRLEPEDQGKLLVSIQTKTLPSLNVAYIADMEGYSLAKICRAWKQLFLWASARGLISSSTKMLGISYDDPMITQASKCRYYACITLSEELPPDPLVGFLTIPGGQYAVCKMECSAEEIYMGYRTIYADWLPWSGFQPDDRPSYEIYLQTPETSPQGKFLMEVCIPVVPLAG